MGYYKIKDLEALSGIKAHTIRIWEKRYELISPKRTDTNIRLYSDDDLKNILLVAILNKNGHKISKIADLEMQERIQLIEESLVNDQLDDAVFDVLILSMIDLEEIKFSHEIDSLFEKHGVIETFTKFIFPFVERIGIMWKVGSITPVQEHFITNLMRQKLISKIDQLEVPIHSNKKVLMYLPEHEYHETSLLLYNYILRSSGKYTYYLGQTVPFDDIVEAIDQIKPDAIVSSFITSIHKEKLLQYVHDLRNKPKHKPKLFLGGMQIENLENDLPDFVKKINSSAILLEV
jgi:DNA-binding transcriptional MerR regulator